MQDVLLEVPRETDRVKFAHLYRSATREASIGGDFYDVFDAQKGRVALLIGDVSGHGVAAARIARSTKDVIHAFAHQSRHPHLILRETNELLIEKRIPGFVTVFLGILNPDNGLLTYCSAGHPNAMLRTGSGEVRLLEAASAPLGVYPGYSWEEDHVQLGVTDLILLYTDGLIEARDGKDFYGQERLMDALGRSGVQPLEDLPRVLMDEVLTFSRSRLADDVAILAATIGGESPPT